MIERPIKPMKCRLTEVSAQVLVRPGMAWEPKWDGYRLIADVRSDRPPVLWSRAGNSAWWYPIGEALTDTVDALLDGELIWFEDGRPSFNGLQNYGSKSNDERRMKLRYVVFDVIELDGEPVYRLPYVERRVLLSDVIEKIESPNVELSLSTEDGPGLWQAMELAQMEGVIGKPLSSSYVMNERATWIKIKRKQRATFAVVGYTHGQGGRSGEIGSLVLADLADGRYRGKAGTGFDGRSLQETKAKLDAARVGTSALDPGQLTRARRQIGPEPVVWVIPRWNAVVEFDDYSREGYPRFPSVKAIEEAT